MKKWRMILSRRSMKSRIYKNRKTERKSKEQASHKILLTTRNIGMRYSGITKLCVVLKLIK